MKKIFLFFSLFICSCSYISGGSGQVVYHWEKLHTGVQKFASDHNECMLAAKAIQIIPNFRSWFYTEEKKLNTRADWNSNRGVWATYVPYPGAQPLIVNAGFDDVDVSPQKYTACMKSKGYWYRHHDIPIITNINLYRIRKPSLTQPFGKPEYYDE